MCETSFYASGGFNINSCQSIAKQKKKILPSSKFGFRRGLSTGLAIGTAFHDWMQAKRKGFHCGNFFFDLSAASKILNSDLLAVLLAVLLAKKALELHCLISSWSNIKELFNRRILLSSCINYAGEQSDLTEVKIGSHLGSVISTLLFLITFAHIQERLSSGIVLSFTDDTTYYRWVKMRKKVWELLEKWRFFNLCMPQDYWLMQAKKIFNVHRGQRATNISWIWTCPRI